MASQITVAVAGGFLALALSGGCLRFGYDVQQHAAIQQPDAAAHDAATSSGRPDAAALPDASDLDAAQTRDASSSEPGADAGRFDAAVADASMDAAIGGRDAGRFDAGEQDGQVDANTADATTGDAAQDAGANTDPCLGRTDLTLCDDIEDPALANWGPPLASNASLQRVTSRSHSTTAALRATTGAASSASKSARIETQAFSHKSSGEIWTRAFFYLTGASAISPAISTLRVSESESPYAGCWVVLRAGDVELGGVTTRLRFLEPFPTDRWACVELHVTIHNSTGTCDVYIDSTVAAQSHEVDTLPASGYSTLSVGVDYSAPTQGPVELYFDDIAASSTRIGCN